MNYTKGEWKRSTTHKNRIICDTEDSIISFVDDFSQPNWESNLHLIAKSPRMYELLEEITTTELNAETLYILQPWLNKVMAILED